MSTTGSEGDILDMLTVGAAFEGGGGTERAINLFLIWYSERRLLAVAWVLEWVMTIESSRYCQQCYSKSAIRRESVRAGDDITGNNTLGAEIDKGAVDVYDECFRFFE